jgi:hypothetical protein
MRKEKMCEGCGAKSANFSMPTERQKRWCSGCGKAHGAINLTAKMCEGSGAKQAHFGTPTERKTRWSSGCGKAHGAINLAVKMCEGCGAKFANFGTPIERKHRWCGGCGKAHGAIHLTNKMCEGWGAKQAHFGTPTERKRRWCSGCGKAHGAIIVKPRGAKRMRPDPPANLSTSSSGTPVADGDRAHEGLASGDATSLPAERATVKQELPVDATRQYGTLESMYRSKAPAHGAMNHNAFGTKRMRQVPVDNLSTSKNTTPEAGARTDETAAGDATSLLLAMVKQELPADATRQYGTPESMYRSMAPAPPHQQPPQGLQVDFLGPGALGIVCQESFS